MKKGLNSPKMDAGLLTHDIADRIQLGIYIYQLADHDDDRSLMLIYANRAAEIYTGLPARKIVGKTIDKIFPVLRTRGIPQSCVGVSFKNITERKNAERKLAASNERYRNLYENTPVMLHSIDSRGMVVAVSNCWLTHTGYRREEVIGRPLTSFLTDESKLFAKIIAYPYFLEHGYVQDISYQVVKKNGGVMDVTLSAIAEKDEEGASCVPWPC